MNTNKNRRFERFSALREHRLLREHEQSKEKLPMAAPAVPESTGRTGEQIREEKESTQQIRGILKKHLTLAAQSNGDPKLLELTEEPLLSMIAAQFESPTAGTVRLPQTALDLFEKYHEVFKDLKDSIKNFKEQAEAIANTSAKGLKAAHQIVEDAQRQYADAKRALDAIARVTPAATKPSATPAAASPATQTTDDSLPGYKDTMGALHHTEAQQQLVIRNTILVDLLDLISQGKLFVRSGQEENSQLKLTTEMEKFLQDAKKKIAESIRDGNARLLELNHFAEFETHLNGTAELEEGDYDTKVQDILEFAKDQAALIDDKTKKRLEGALGTAQQLKADLEMTLDQWSMKNFPERFRYINRLGGTNVDFFIRNAVGPDGKFHMEHLKTGIATFLGLGEDVVEIEEKVVGALGTGGALPPLNTEAVGMGKKYGIDAANLANHLQALFKNGITGLTAELATINKTRQNRGQDAISAHEFQEDLLNVWDTTNAQKNLREKFPGIENPAGVSVSALAFRAQLPDDVAAELSASKLRVGVGTVVDAAKLVEIDLMRSAITSSSAKKIADSVVMYDEKGQPIMTTAGIEQLIELITLVSYDSTIQDKVAAGDGARKSAEEWVQLHIVDEQKDPVTKNVDLEKQILIKRGDGDYKVNLQNLENALLTLKTKQWFQLANKKNAAAGITQVTVPRSVKMYAHEALSTAQAGGKLWTKYITSLPRNVMEQPGDAELKALRNKKEALDDYEGALQGMLGSVNANKSFFDMVFKDLSARRGNGAILKQELNLFGKDVLALQGQSIALLQASAQVIDQLRNHGWDSKTVPEQLFSLWLVMRLGADRGLESAGRFLDRPNPAEDGPNDDIVAFLNGEINERPNLTPEERQAFYEYIDKVNGDKNVLRELKSRGIELRPGALGMLAANGYANTIDTWMAERDRTKLIPILQLAIEGPGVVALIKAFVEGDSASYDFLGRRETITPEDARLGVGAIQQQLQQEARQVPLEKKQLKNAEMNENPIESGIRAGAEALKDMWDGDWIKKGQVVATVGVIVWALHRMWKNGWNESGSDWEKFGAKAMVALPLALAANSVYKRQTGRDILGEWSRFVPKNERNSSLEQFRRRGAMFERYKFLMQQGGHAVLREILDCKDPIPLRDLLEWRKGITEKGGLDYKNKAPPNLNASRIKQYLGDKAAPEEAYEKSYLAFECLCVQVAELRGKGGKTPEEKAQFGADFIEKHYKGTMTMIEVMNAEFQSPELQSKIVGNRSVMEVIRDSVGAAGPKITSGMKRLAAKAEIKGMEFQEVAEDYWVKGKQWTLETAQDVKDWFELSYPKVMEETKADLQAAYRWGTNTTEAARLYLVKKGPGMVDWVFEKGVQGADKVHDIARNTYRMLLTNGVTGPVLESLIAGAKELLGLDLPEEMKQEKYVVEVLSKTDNMRKDLIQQVGAFAKVDAAFGQNIDKWLVNLAGLDVTGIDLKVNPQAYAELFESKVGDAYKRMQYFELLKKRIFAHLVAERVRDIYSNRNTPKYTAVQLPIDAHWDAFPAPGTPIEDKLYAHILTNYNPAFILSIIGNERTVVGIMRLWRETIPDSKRGTFSALMLYTNLEEHFTRDTAEEFLMPQIRSYFAPYLKEAKESMSFDEFEAYSHYADAVMVNVTLEAILDNKTNTVRPPDLKLTKALAKNMLGQFRLRRGVSPNPDKLDKGILKQFIHEPREETEPKVLTSVKRDPKMTYILYGEDVPSAKPAPDETAAKSSQTPALKKAPTLSAADIAQLEAEGVKADTDSLLGAIAAPNVAAAQKQKFRTYVEQKLKDVPTMVPELDGDMRQSIQYFLGATDENALKYETALVDKFKEAAYPDPAKHLETANNLVNTIGKAREQYQYPDQRARLQHLLDRAVLDIARAVLEDLMKTETKKLADDPTKFQQWEQTLIALYRVTDLQTPYADYISSLLEYLWSRGNYNATTYDQYVKYLDGLSLKPPKEIPGRQGAKERIKSEAVIDESALKGALKNTHGPLWNEVNKERAEKLFPEAFPKK